MTQITLSELVTSVGGGTVVMAARDSSVAPGTIAGVYHADRRIVSHLDLTVSGHDLHLIAATAPAADTAVTHHLVVDGDGAQVALLTVTRQVAGQMTQQMVVRALGGPVTLALRVQVAADFGDLLRLRYGAPPPAPVPLRVDGEALVASSPDGEAADAAIDRSTLGVRVAAPEARADTDGTLTWTVRAAAGAPGSATLMVDPSPGEAATPGARSPRPATGARSPLRVTGAHRWRRAVETSAGDLTALRIALPGRDLAYTGAGAPWYMALFGRDALLTAHQALLLGADQALDALDALAAFQGTSDDPRTGEEPGKILHELRTGHSGIFGLPPLAPYFGSVDATPLFVVLLGAAHRWGAPADRIRALLPAARAAIDWCAANAARDARGHLTYEADTGALHNKGWKDSATSMVHTDGNLASGPIALVEAQGYHWRALRELAALEAALGDAGAVTPLEARAAAVRAALVRDFWDANLRLLAMALDGSGAPLAVASSNAGHCLWTGAVDGDIAAGVADMLAAPALNAGWGVRTLGATEQAYDPMSYHCGSVWPHDSALVIDGLARTGRRDVAAGLIAGLLDAAEHHGWRLPELYGGYGPDEVPAPVPYPVACRPQAWSAATPLQLLRTLLRIDPDVPAGTVAVGPALAPVSLQVSGIRLGPHTLDLTVDRGRVEAHASDGLRVVSGDGAV